MEGGRGGEGVRERSSGAFEPEKDAVRSRLSAALSKLENGLVERGAEARLVLLAACCGEHLLLIGPPGTAKSEVARRLGSIVSDDAAFFQRVLTRFSVPEELFGPLSLRSLEQDVYRRNTTGYLPEAQVAFIDEVFKANSAVLNALLMILNEKRFDNGNEQVDVPLVCLVGASNELPQDPELQALYDRFLFRKLVNPVSDDGITDLLSSTPSEVSAEGEVTRAMAMAKGEGRLEPEWLEDLMEEARREVAVPNQVIDILARLRSHLMEECEPPIYISDRRLLKCVGMLKMCAFTNGRKQVSEFDTLLLKHVCWSTPEEQDKVNDWIVDQLVSQTETKQLRYLLLGVFTRCCKAMSNREGGSERGGGGEEYSPRADQATCQVTEDVEELVEILDAKLQSMKGQMESVKDLLMGNVWLCEGEAAVVVEQLQRPMENSVEQIECLLSDALTVEASYKQEVPLYVVADLLPEYWSDFIRKGNIEDVKPLGLKPLSDKK
ncbi:P-loop-containing nucleoside triphosphate hydrolase [Chloropicon primus]|uniref:P-loop-containing nucleoside triphosphate hydrolase n=2 Tax=Chloropicon primus TaxID=1764295 RepID=A0A5B8MZH2_9CHLO|nr:P-loop-containing nucleoside triphosphate hydrolase [Chloropicon primus]UPR04014.1 P-loop-containing nucleoside triphosphate hydrolase [Chloropicon primus]|eukprot:QDZ24804.1 P-loop-containing nucleoside triphosphate hydrolase [Chloropicon primus]